MITLYVTVNDDVYGKLKCLLSGHIPAPIEILRTENGKPYLAGNSVFFSIAHSGNKAVIALSDLPVGVDIETIRGAAHAPVLSRFSAREQREIHGETDFLRHWTAREAYIKMTGGALAEDLKKIEIYGGDIYYCGNKQAVDLFCRLTEDSVISVCGNGGPVRFDTV